MQWERPPEKPQAVFARKALTAGGWQRDVLVTIDAKGMIARVDAAANPAIGTPSFDLLLPGITNVHSHAFQRAMAGLTERASRAGEDNFWSWRNVMYDFALKLTPEQAEVIARALYIELLRQGFTGVGEFHYLHHDSNGKPYAAITEMSDRIIVAAQSAGIHLTHLPVLYETANFGGVAASDKQQRFVHTADQYLRLLESLRPHCTGDVALGVAPHSLRAVRPESLNAVLEALPALGMGDCPVHIHIAEQEKEVADCMAWGGLRPVEWLLGHMPVDKRWCLVHATHMTIN